MINARPLILAHFAVAFAAFVLALVLGEWQMIVRSPWHAWLDNPENRIPLRASDEFAVHLKSRRGGSWSGDAVNRDLLAQMIGVRSDTLRAGVPKVHCIVDAAVSRGQTVVGGLCQISSIRWAEGSAIRSSSHRQAKLASSSTNRRKNQRSSTPPSCGQASNRVSKLGATT